MGLKTRNMSSFVIKQIEFSAKNKNCKKVSLIKEKQIKINILLFNLGQEIKLCNIYFFVFLFSLLAQIND